MAAEYVFGADIGGTTVKLGLFDARQELLLESWEIPTRTQDEGRHILPDIAASVKKNMLHRSLSAEDVMGIGVGAPGAVLDNGIVNRCVNLGWGVVDAAAGLTGLLDGMKVLVANDADVAVLGEQWKGGGRGVRDLVLITLGTGIGVGIILGDRLVPGFHGAAGELGHLKVSDTETEQCSCGKYGCLEQYASANGIVRMTRRELANQRRGAAVLDTGSTVPTALTDSDTLTCREIFERAKEGDALACRILEQFGRLLGEAIAAVTCLIDPELILIGGGVSNAGRIVLELIEKYYMPAAFHACRETQLQLAQLGNDAGIYGAARLVLQNENRCN